MTAPAPERQGRLTELDGLRGWLSLMVVLSHVAGMRWMPLEGAPPAPNVAYWVMWNFGAPAVDAFFVLSGLVVGRSLITRPRPYLQYLGERARRLLPVGAVGLAAGLLIHPMLYALDPVSPVRDLAVALRPQDWAGVLTLGLVPFNANTLNPPLWSLVIEQQIALVMPLLVVIARRTGPWALGAALLLTLPAFWNMNLYAAWFIPAFMLGIVIRDVRLPRALALAALIAGVLLWQHRQWTGDSLFYRQTAMLGAGMMIMGLRSAAGPLQTCLQGRVSQWLGHVSFSLYATHFLPLTLAVLLTGTPNGAWLGVPLALLLGWAVWAGVERPANRSRRTTLVRSAESA